MKFCVFLLSALLFLSCANKEKEAAEAKVIKDRQEKILRKKKEVADRALYLRNLFTLDSIEEAKVKKYVVKKISGSDYGGDETTVKFISYTDRVNEVIERARLEMRDDKYIAKELKYVRERWGGEIRMNISRSYKLGADGYRFKYVITDPDGKEIKRGNGYGDAYRLGKEKWCSYMHVEFFNRRPFPLHVYIIDSSIKKKFEFKISAIYK